MILLSMTLFLVIICYHKPSNSSQISLVNVESYQDLGSQSNQLQTVAPKYSLEESKMIRNVWFIKKEKYGQIEPYFSTAEDAANDFIKFWSKLF